MKSLFATMALVMALGLPVQPVSAQSDALGDQRLKEAKAACLPHSPGALPLKEEHWLDYVANLTEREYRAIIAECKQIGAGGNPSPPGHERSIFFIEQCDRNGARCRWVEYKG